MGLPASEAQNALLVPTAGHELGHAIWRDTPINKIFDTQIRKEVVTLYRNRWSSLSGLFPAAVNPDSIETDLEARSVWTPTYILSARQLEEVFCDCVGVWLFGESYLLSFRYLLAPDSVTRQSDSYPPNRRRAEFSLKASENFGDRVDVDHAEFFRQIESSREQKVEFADEVTERLVPNVIAAVRDFFGNKSLSRPTAAATKICEESLRSLRPVAGYDSIANVLNGAWNIRRSLTDWVIPGVKDERKVDILNDLVFKSFEVMEWDALKK